MLHFLKMMGMPKSPRGLEKRTWLHCVTCKVGGMRKEHGATGTERWMSTERLRITSFLVCDLLDYVHVVRTRISIIRRSILLQWSLQLSWFKSYWADESWMREQKGVVELSGCMGISVGMGMFMWINGEELAIRLFELEAIPFHFFDFLIWKSTLCVHLARRYIMYVWCVPHTQCCCVCCVRVFDVCVMCDGVHVHSWCKLHLCYCYVLRVTVVLVHTQT